MKKFLFFIFGCLFYFTGINYAQEFSLENIKAYQASLNYPSQIINLYQKLGFNPIWNETNKKKLENLIVNSMREGLNPKDYQIDLLEKTEKFSIEQELKLTDTLIKLAYHIYYGKVNPNKVLALVSFSKKKDIVVDTLVTLLNEDKLEDLFTALAPEFEEYQVLKDYLRRYQEIIEATQSVELKLNKSLTLGEQSSLIPEIRRRLYLLGYLDSFNENEVYDHELKEAVKRFQRAQQLKPNGIIDSKTVRLLTLLPKKRVVQISLNLEKFRWLPTKRPETVYVWVNLPSFDLFLVNNGKVVFYSPVIIGKSNSKDFRPTPVLYSQITHMVLNPPWNIPPNVYKKDFFPKLTKDPEFLLKQGIKVYANGTEIDPFQIKWETLKPSKLPFQLVQPPGNGNALGKVKFLFSNPFDVYLHDTPKKNLFKYSKRDFSSGCVRVQKAVELANFLISMGYVKGWDQKRFINALKTNQTIYISLNPPIPVYLVYFTVSVKKPYIYYFEDLYGYDQKLAQLLNSH
ncbi:L,D-transpeptidase family protein [Thermodesulfobacterium sp. TA1]|uniref:L,D-transpeptidase family protein n=1 Tax=Thermodesulfobacterium sp. TA1 TaxID=2234087 RepID=UPI001231B5ED|nr:L,D-transpeptidase family protein [Thermodesulfobacterium sp. TA1]QER42393.1 L,D-transpeptidase family protein [Thermodesulfobacterium sp. TA1]